MVGRLRVIEEKEDRLPGHIAPGERERERVRVRQGGTGRDKEYTRAAKEMSECIAIPIASI